MREKWSPPQKKIKKWSLTVLGTQKNTQKKTKKHGGGGGRGRAGASEAGEGSESHCFGVGPWTTVPSIVRLANE